MLGSGRENKESPLNTSTINVGHEGSTRNRLSLITKSISFGFTLSLSSTFCTNFKMSLDLSKLSHFEIEFATD